MNEKGEMFWVIHDDTISHLKGFPRHDNYYFFPDMPDGLGGWSIHITDLFPAKIYAVKALKSRLEGKKKEIEDKIKRLEKVIEKCQI